ncbi:MAG: hypothetical protein ACFFDT_13145 [Candidatus Hodarchaeota archaeon]
MSLILLPVAILLAFSPIIILIFVDVRKEVMANLANDPPLVILIGLIFYFLIWIAMTLMVFMIIRSLLQYTVEGKIEYIEYRSRPWWSNWYVLEPYLTLTVGGSKYSFVMGYHPFLRNQLTIGMWVSLRVDKNNKISSIKWRS